MKKQFQLVTVISLLCLATFLAWRVQTTSAHGTEVSYKLTTAVEIEALYDTGEPMSDAQVIIYAPDNPAEAWLQGQADAQGHFIFTPDTEIAGRWDVTIRTAGHGDIIYIPIEAGTVMVSNDSGPDTLQTILMGAMGLWGFIGTALFFSRRK